MDDFDKTRLMPVRKDTAASAGANADLQAQRLRQHAAPQRRAGTCLLRLLQTDHAATAQPNPVMAAATPLLLTLAALHDHNTPNPGGSFEHLLVRAVHQFDQQAISRGVSSDCANAARYILCTALDEAILATDWAQSCDWSQHSLLQRFHNETHGGERFFSLLEALLLRHTQFADLLQLCHFCLNIGFSGRLLLDRHGHYRKQALCSQICQLLLQQQGESAQRELLLRPPPTVGRLGTEPSSSLPRRHALLALIVCGCMFAGLRLWLDISTARASAAFMQSSALATPTTMAPRP